MLQFHFSLVFADVERRACLRSHQGIAGMELLRASQTRLLDLKRLQSLFWPFRPELGSLFHRLPRC